MQPAGGGVDEFWKSLHIGCEQLAQSSDVENQPHQRHGGCVFFQNILGGAPGPPLCLAGFGVDSHLAEQNLTHLRRRRYVERASGHGVCLLLERLKTLAQLAGKSGELGGIHSGAFPFHIGQDGDKRQFDVLEKSQLSFFGCLAGERRFETQQRTRSLAGYGCGIGRSCCGAPGCGDVVEAHTEAKVLHGQFLEVVARFGGAYIMCHGGVEPAGAAEFHAQTAQHNDVALYVVANHSRALVGEQFLQQGYAIGLQRAFQCHVCRNGCRSVEQISGIIRFESQRYADCPCRHCLLAVGNQRHGYGLAVADGVGELCYGSGAVEYRGWYVFGYGVVDGVYGAVFVVGKVE